MAKEDNLKNLLEDRRVLLDGLPAHLPAPELSDEFLRALVDNASAYARIPLKFLSACGFEVRPPADFPAGSEGDAELERELWRLLLACALVRFFFVFTDHLDDRALYTYLYEEALQDPTSLDPGDDPPSAYVHDLLMVEPVEMARLRVTYYRDLLPEVIDGDIAYLEEMGEPVPDPAPRPSNRDQYLP